MPVNTALQRLAVSAINNYKKGYVDTVSNEAKELNWLKKEGRTATGVGGLQQTWQAQTATHSVSTYSGEALDNFLPFNPRIQASLGYAGYKSTDRVSEADVAISSGAQQLIDLIKASIDGMRWAIARAICTDFYLDGTTTTYSSTPLVGAQGFIINTGSYAGVSYSSEPNFFGNNLNILSGGIHASFSTDPIASLSQAVAAAELGDQLGMMTGKPDAIFMPFVQFAQFSSVIFAQGRAEIGDQDQDVSVTSLRFEGIPVIKSRFVPANSVYIFDSKSLKLQTPFDKLITFDAKRELSPDGNIMLTKFFGMLSCEKPRNNVRVTVS